MNRQYSRIDGFLKLMVRMAGFELTTLWFVARYSIQLSYIRTRFLDFNKFRGTSIKNRRDRKSCDPFFTSLPVVERTSATSLDSAKAARHPVKQLMGGLGERSRTSGRSSMSAAEFVDRLYLSGSFISFVFMEGILQGGSFQASLESKRAEADLDPLANFYRLHEAFDLFD